MTNTKRYHTLNQFLREKFGEKLHKICIDGGFTCPNRDGVCGFGGCIFCGERGSGEHINNEGSIGQQVREYLSLKGAEGKYIAYFQNFTNTYATPDVLKKKYTEALCDERIVALAVGTRPDCIDDDIARLLASFAGKYYVWVELGLQTANDKTADFINRGYHRDRFLQAVDILNSYGIDIVAHLIIGLPGESKKDITETIRFINKSKIQGIKVHSLYVMEGTKLAQMYRNGEFAPISVEEHIELAAFVISSARPDLIIHRVTGDCPKDLLVAPDWKTDKSTLVNRIDAYLEVNNLYQGSLYEQY